MASLKSIITGGRFYWHDAHRQIVQDAASVAITALRSPDTILIRAQSVWDDIVPKGNSNSPSWREDWMRALKFATIPRPRPPYSMTWLEAADQYLRFALLVQRIENISSLLAQNRVHPQIAEGIRQDAPAVLIQALIWHDFEGSACYDGNIFYWLDAQGVFVHSARDILRVERLSEADRQKNLWIYRLRESWMLHTFARMNCANVQLVPIKGHRHRDDPVCSSVWHEIKVTSVPQLRRQHSTAAPDGEHHHVRFHWVRGHYADYTKGAGLFGNPKLRAVFWIPEHRAGNEELGTVISSYRVQGAQTPSRGDDSSDT